MNSWLKFLMHILLCSVLALFSPFNSVSAVAEKSSDPDYVFYKGNTLYEEGKYDEAIREYSKLLEQGLESGNLYYNIGNCYFKKGDHGRALLNYERAKKLIPEDSDLASNYNYARSMIKGNITDKSASWVKRIFNKFDFLTMNGLTVFLSVVYALTVFLLLAGLFIHPLKRYYRYLLPVLLIVFLAGGFSLYSRVSKLGKEAVIISENADARFEPIDNATTHFTLHEGMKVYVLESKTKWSKVKRFDGKIGWLRNVTLEKI